MGEGRKIDTIPCMAITFTCECGRSVQVGDEFAGQPGTCPGCGRTVSIPGPDGQITEHAPVLTPRDGVATVPWQRTPPAPRDSREAEIAEDFGHLVAHAGVPIENDDDLFADAPPAIGKLFSAYTSLKSHQAPTPEGLRFGWFLFVFFIGLIITSLALNYLLADAVRGLGPQQGKLVILLISIVVSVVFGGAVYWWMGFYHTCSYVGTDGIASYYCSGDRDNIGQTGYFLFQDAAELRTSMTRHYTNGVYTGTNYSYVWSDERGKVMFTLAGRFSSKDGTPAFSDPYYFAVAAESAWSLYLFRNIDHVSTSEKLLFFGLTAGNYIQLGQGLFILTQGGKTVELRSEQIEKMTIGDGVISVWEVGGKEGWFVNSGIHQFLYAELGNARFFMFALEKLLGIRF